MGEGLLALGAIIATTAGFQTVAQWEEIYTAFNQGGVNAFVEGGGNILEAGLGIPASLSATILATMAVLFAATTMDTGVRLQRFVVQEVGEIMGFTLNKFVSTLIVLLVALGLVFGSGSDGSGGMLIWPLFGTTNQLLAALTLSVITVMLLVRGRSVLPAAIPLVFVFVMSVYALIVQLGGFWTTQNWLLLVLDLVILVAALWVMFEAVLAMRRARAANSDAELAAAGGEPASAVPHRGPADGVEEDVEVK